MRIVAPFVLLAGSLLVGCREDGKATTVAHEAHADVPRAADDALSAQPASPASTDIRQLVLTAVGGVLLVTDAQGRRIGQRAPGDATLIEIPGGIIDGDEAPEADEDEAQVFVITIPAADSGTYNIALTATSTRSDAAVRAGSEQANGTFLTSTQVISVASGRVYHFSVAFDPRTKAAPVIAGKQSP
ncbi:MAG: NUDIX hydrolase [Gemmatimonadaceae bacterium]|nr:NUDIX hydrolase [Gemmatimonadaceae bacterium]